MNDVTHIFIFVQKHFRSKIPTYIKIFFSLYILFFRFLFSLFKIFNRFFSLNSKKNRTEQRSSRVRKKKGRAKEEEEEEKEGHGFT